MSRTARALVLAALVALLTALAAAGLPGLSVAPDLEGSLEGHPAHADLLAFRATFGNLETFFLSLPAGSLGELYDLVARLRAVPGVKRVSSLLDFLPRPPASRADLEAELAQGRALERFRAMLPAYRLAHGFAIARDGSHFGLLIAAAPGSLAAVEEAAGAHRARLLGYPVTERRVIELVRSSNRRFVPIAFVGGVVILSLFLRRVQLVVLAACTVFLPLVWLLGTMGWRGERLNSFSTMLLPILLSSALTATMYVFSAVLEVDAADQDALDRHLREHVRVPQLLCALAAIIGFASMMLTPAAILRRFGGWATAGVIATVASAIAIPRTGLALTAAIHAAPVARVGTALAGLAAGLAARPGRAFVVWAALAALAVGGVARLSPASSASASLLDGDPVARATAEYVRLFGSPPAVELVYRARDLPAAHPEAVLQVARLQARLAEDPLVDSTVSLADLYLDAGSRVAGERQERLASAREVELYGELLDGDDDPRAGFLAPDGLSARLLVRLKTDEAFAVRAFAGRVAALDAPDLPRPQYVTGLQYASAIVHAEGVTSALTALGTAFAGDLIVFAFLFGSLPLALLSIAPNIMPLLLMYGAVGLAGRPLDVAIALAGPVVYGMILDDTMHLVHRMRAALAGGMTPREAVVDTVEKLGRAVVVTSCTLAVSLGLSALAPFALAASFGWAAAAIVLVGLACELALTPLLVAQFPRVLYDPRRDKSH